jgi:glycosyltransferase involved in cell wall biosynthesis
MHFLVGINNNLHEWRDTLKADGDKPRLPLPYAFGAAFLKRGHRLSAIDVCSRADKDALSVPFEKIYYQSEIITAMKGVDTVSLWGGLGVSAIMKQPLLPRPRQRVLLNTYVWQLEAFSTWKAKKLALATRIAARFAKGVVVMTQEQAERAREDLPDRVPVLSMRCGIDTAYYRSSSDQGNVPEAYKDSVDYLMKSPFVIMPGDELRFNQDALDIIKNSDMHLVRISQYSDKGATDRLKQQITHEGLTDRLVVFERISYPFMRFLLRNAAAYAGLVDSTWQPAGWTVACEALASGLPVVLYEGLVSRELVRLGATELILRSVPMRDIRTFQQVLESIVHNDPDPQLSLMANMFAAENLNLEITGEEFVQQVESLERNSV